MEIPPSDLARLNSQFEISAPQEILNWAVENYWPSIVMSSSFQTQSVPLLHMVAQIKPELPIYFLDTGYHFPETLLYKEKLQKTLGLNVIDLRNEELDGPQESVPGGPLYRSDPDRCCYLRKVAPMEKALQDVQAWVTGIRREQTVHRPRANIFERKSNGLLKVNPLLNWVQKDVWSYISRHDLPVHPLFSQGYLSIGCAPCTRPAQPGEDERTGRWAGSAKVECGLHTELFENDNFTGNE